jgi:hypothetical protein
MKNCILLFIFLVSSSNLFSQDCASDEYHQYKMSTDSLYRSAYKKQLTYMKEHTLSSERSSGNNSPNQVLVIPTVVHVIHLGEPLGTGSNIPDALIYQMLAQMNNEFRGVNGIGVDTEIEFCLASRDPNGCFTTGINRVDGSAVPNYASGGIEFVNCAGSADEVSVKSLSYWPVNDYYNIWVVHQVCGAGGYASGLNGYPFAGTVVMATYLSAATHESGHCLWLPHTFSGDFNNQCPVDTNCAVDGDMICDTPPHRVADCGAVNPCSSTGNWDNSRYNYMSYCSLANRFTPDQKTMMIACLNSQLNSTLLNSPGCMPVAFNPITLNVQNMSCHNICDGSITVTESALCTPLPFTCSWSTGDTGRVLTGLCAGTYSVTLTDPNNQTITYSASIVNPDSVSISVATGSSLCSAAATATATGGTPFVSPTLCGVGASAITVGTGTHLVSPTNYPAVYGNNFWGARHQMLFHDSELTTAGLMPGRIASIAFQVYTVLGTANLTDFTVKIKHTSATAISQLDNSGFQTVLNPTNITITTGWNTHPFNTPFVWDGVSNVLVEVCFNNTSSVQYQNSQIYMTLMPFQSVVYNLADNLTACSDLSNQWTTTARPNVRFTQCPDTLVYSYQWSNGDTLSSVNGLTSGTYTLVVTDGNGCSATTTVNINSGSTINAGNDTTVYPMTAVQLGGSPTAFGFPPFVYSWSPVTGLSSSVVANPVATNSVTTSYIVNVTDANNCLYTDTVQVVIDSSLSTVDFNSVPIVSLYPNPVGNDFVVDIVNWPSAACEMRIVDMLGRELYFNRQQLSRNSSNTIRLNADFLSPGVYFLELRGDSTKKLIRFQKV